MVNQRMKAQSVLGLVRKTARRHGYTVAADGDRGKGSHQVYIIRDQAGREVARFNLTRHSKDVSWTVLRQIEDGLSGLFGEKWMEKR